MLFKIQNVNCLLFICIYSLYCYRSFTRLLDLRSHLRLNCSHDLVQINCYFTAIMPSKCTDTNQCHGYSLIDNKPLTSFHTLCKHKPWLSNYCWVKRNSDCFSHLSKSVAKLTSSYVSILTCENWYWDREMTSMDWKFRMTEYWDM